MSLNTPVRQQSSIRNFQLVCIQFINKWCTKIHLVSFLLQSDSKKYPWKFYGVFWINMIKTFRHCHIFLRLPSFAGEMAWDEDRLCLFKLIFCVTCCLHLKIFGLRFLFFGSQHFPRFQAKHKLSNIFWWPSAFISHYQFSLIPI